MPDMKSREFDPLRLDVAAFAKDGGALEGEWPLAELERLAESVLPGTVASAPAVTWRLTGELRAAQGGESQVWLHAVAHATVQLECQRCLKPMTEALAAERSFQFVHGEDAAADLDADSEDDVLALTRALDARELVEDELLLELPIVPRHDVCPDPIPVVADDLPEEAAPNPFAKLAALKRGGLPN
ncbi:hypothetical protein GCM10007918_49540 [Piscinibacter gummiphilus]|nr:hypothetical protein GCM10007918_49540 [Piscinibacter gummiphilus]